MIIKNNETLKRVKAVILGHAVGDALGVPVEFFSRARLDKDPVTDMRGWGSHSVPEGCWSDDTSMSLAALAVLKKGRVDRSAIMQSFARFLNDGEYTATGACFDIGSVCKRAIERYSDGGHPSDEPYGLSGEYDNGNGSLMRINPFVLFATLIFLNGTEEGHWLWMACVQAGSELTHAHECSVMGCLIYGYCLSFLFENATRESLVEGIKFAGNDLDWLPEFDRYTRIFAPDFEGLPREQIKSTGYIVDTLEAALWCVLTTDSYRECVLKAVNLGDDTDTVAAVAGGIAGALYGLDSIPTEWLDRLLRRDYIEKMCEEAYNNWVKQ